MTTATQIRTYNVLFCDCPECGSRLNLEDATVGREVTHTCGMRAEVTAIFTGFARVDIENAVCLKILQPAREDEDYVPPSPEALAALDAGLESARTHAPVDLGSFAQYTEPQINPELESKKILDSIDSLTALNRSYLKQNPSPPVLLADVQVTAKYFGDPRTIPQLLLDKTVSIVELTAWRMAELLERNERATCRVLWTDRGIPRVIVRRPNGSIEIVDELLLMRSQ